MGANDVKSPADSDLSAEVRRLLFFFEDIITLDERSIRLILREADPTDLTLALRGADDDLKQKILVNMPERGAQLLGKELQVQSPHRPRDTEFARGRVVAIVRRLDERGALALSSLADPRPRPFVQNAQGPA